MKRIKTPKLPKTVKKHLVEYHGWSWEDILYWDAKLCFSEVNPTAFWQDTHEREHHNGLFTAIDRGKPHKHPTKVTPDGTVFLA
ncbi:hypothetical protein DRO51_01475 [Candidatus Bathyarchaeota archaeon]|nr:MAG: hypothetical protein DRO51_01475 [Candidatus Bathyarchaeota archaeon]